MVIVTNMNKIKQWSFRNGKENGNDRPGVIKGRSKDMIDTF